MRGPLFLRGENSVVLRRGGCHPDAHVPESVVLPAAYGFLGSLHLPPAGGQDRTPTDVHRAARIRTLAERLPAATGACPKCSVTLDTSIEAHVAGEGLCSACGNRYTIGADMACTNCLFSQGGVFSLALLGSTALLAFPTAHDIIPIASDSERFNAAVMDYEESVQSLDPPEATFTFTVDGDTLTLSLADAGKISEVVPRSEFENG